MGDSAAAEAVNIHTNHSKSRHVRNRVWLYACPEVVSILEMPKMVIIFGFLPNTYMTSYIYINPFALWAEPQRVEFGHPSSRPAR